MNLNKYRKKFSKLYYLNEFSNKFKEKRDYLFFKICKINELIGFNLKGKKLRWSFRQKK